MAMDCHCQRRDGSARIPTDHKLPDAKDEQGHRPRAKAQPMQCGQGGKTVQRIGIAERRKRRDVGVHDAIQYDMRAGSCRRTDCHGQETQALPLERIRQPELARTPAASKEERNGGQRHQRGAHIGMEEPMQTILVSEHVVQRLNIDQNVCRTEGEKADMPRCKDVDYCARAEVKRSDWHVLMCNVIS